MVSYTTVLTSEDQFMEILRVVELQLCRLITWACVYMWRFNDKNNLSVEMFHYVYLLALKRSKCLFG